jgi:hypothetical protein
LILVLSVTVASELGPVEGLSGTADKTTLKGLLSVNPAPLKALNLILNVADVGDKARML